MEPAGKLLMSGMKEHFLKSKDARYTPAWIWGMSDMRALTAAMAEKECLQLRSKSSPPADRSAASRPRPLASRMIASPAIMPVVAPIIDQPRRSVCRKALRAANIVKANEQFLGDLVAGKIPRRTRRPRAMPSCPATRFAPDERVTLQQARDAGWSDAEMKAASTLAWEVCRTTNYPPCAAKARPGDFLQPRHATTRSPPACWNSADAFRISRHFRCLLRIRS